MDTHSEKMSGYYLKKLSKGDNKITLTNCYSEAIPDKLDLERFERGQQFFRRNISACLFTMMCSLVCGLCVTNLLEPLVFTGKSDTPRKSLTRYLKTMAHVVQWHCGNVWDINSKARKSLQIVCGLHDRTRVDMIKKTEKLYVSQYDMSLVQAGFMGAIIMYPKQFGIKASQGDLKDYVYFWRWIGYLLGMEDSNNICVNSLEEAIAICHEIENDIVYPALHKPPPHFHHMAKAFTDGSNILHNFKFFTPESVVSFSLDLAKKERLPHSFVDKIRIIFLKVFVNLIYYSSLFRNFMNRNVEHLCLAVQDKRFDAGDGK